jgi:hypothetical protein
MLFEIKSLGESFQKRFARIPKWSETYFTETDKNQLKKISFIKEVYESTILVEIDSQTHSHIPSQYVLYAVLTKEFAQQLYEHIKVIKSLKESSLSNASIHDLIVNRDSSNKIISLLSEDEKSFFFDLFGEDKNKALGAKSMLSVDSKTKAKGLRGEKEFFASVMLQITNVPNNSNSLLGEFIYYLCEHPDIYHNLQKSYIKFITPIIEDTVASKFAISVLRFLWDFDYLEKIKHLLTENEDPKYLSLELEDHKLTSIFRSSSTLLSINDLSSGEAIRFTPNPQFKLQDKFLYTSTQWTAGQNKRLDIDNLKFIIDKSYKEFEIKIENGKYSLLPKSFVASSFNKDERSTPKPFLLLAGISGTGKSRFVRNQAEQSSIDGSNFRLIPVRPDWHEPSDLLGYVSRINGEEYVASSFLKFIVKAWIEACESATRDLITLKPLESITTYWACLDEMNLAPVEQYFADYLAVLETRDFNDDGKYQCSALVHPAQLLKKGNLKDLQEVLGLEFHNDLWDYFKTHGIPIPPNLIVAGTVNMDETTHGFSRKVIDRAFTIDFGAFFPNEFDEIFEPKSQPRPLTFSRHSRANREDLANVTADTDGSKSIAFLKEVNDCLKDTPFELAFRALNELLLAVMSFAPKDDLELSAVWDDFLMTKLLPRIEGDSEKLSFDGTDSLLTALKSIVEKKLSSTGRRPDLLRTSSTGGVIDIENRSIKKIDWMQSRLVNSNFTSFWP